ncbi:hypothetical protein RHSIM_RhsimUnG0132400 [Rhododendron simsii]|uniref:Uncharacterized protein n=1 Tax=Rhododendron simsii TaxID=118357 RepID=A0A834FWY8_RHOSS|nr:hypothetical protein RHSIM_RhsimUnG0132400 [Rhododendron simsii]
MIGGGMWVDGLVEESVGGSVGLGGVTGVVESVGFCKSKLPLESPPNGFIKVGSSLFPSTGNPCLDFFYYVCPNRKPFHLEHYLEMAWNHNPLATLKIICVWRGARETGKPIRESFYRVALWIHRNHPKTLANNLEAFARYGYLKDLLESCTDHEWENSSAAVNYNTAGQTVEKNLIKTVQKDRCHKYEEEEEENNFDGQRSCRKSDMELLKCGGISKISLAAKWCPSLGSSYDRSTLICESISRRMFPLDSDPEYKEMEEAHYAYRVRDRLRKHVLVPLCEALIYQRALRDVAEEPWRKYILVFNSEPDLVKFDLSELLDSDAFGYDDLVWGGDSWEKDYEVMRNKYEEEGYILPELVFWKISGSQHYPMRSMKKGVTILNGHSKILMKYFGGRRLFGWEEEQKQRVLVKLQGHLMDTSRDDIMGMEVELQQNFLSKLSLCRNAKPFTEPKWVA